MKEKETKIEKEARYIKNTYWVIFWIIIALISIPLWYLTVPLIVAWFVWKKTKLDKKKKLIITGLAVLFLIVMCSIKYYTDRTPTIIITEPENNFSIQANDIIIKGIVTPKKSKVTINSNSIPVKDGSFIYDAKLIKENNRFVFIATNSGNENKTSIIINRILTEEEIAEKEAKRQVSIEARREAEEEREAEELAKQEEIEAKKEAEKKAKQKVCACIYRSCSDDSSCASFCQSKGHNQCNGNECWQRDSRFASIKDLFGYSAESYCQCSGKWDESQYGQCQSTGSCDLVCNWSGQSCLKAGCSCCNY